MYLQYVHTYVYIVSNQGSENCLDPGSCLTDKEEGKYPTPDPDPPPLIAREARQPGSQLLRGFYSTSETG